MAPDTEGLRHQLIAGIAALAEREAAPRLETGDALNGGQAITDFVNQLLGLNIDRQTTYGWILRKKIPAGRFGGRVIGSKRAISEALARSAGLTS